LLALAALSRAKMASFGETGLAFTAGVGGSTEGAGVGGAGGAGGGTLGRNTSRARTSAARNEAAGLLLSINFDVMTLLLRLLWLRPAARAGCGWSISGLSWDSFAQPSRSRS